MFEILKIVVRVDCFFFFQAEDGIRDYKVTGVQTCALPILRVLFMRVLSMQCLQRVHALAGTPMSSRALAMWPTVRSTLCHFSRPNRPMRKVLKSGPSSHCRDRKSTRLNSSHLVISYAVFCLKKKKQLDHGLPVVIRAAPGAEFLLQIGHPLAPLSSPH